MVHQSSRASFFVSVWGVLSLVIAGLVIAGPARAQEQFWIQLQALPRLADAESRARFYAQTYDNLHGFRLGQAWYAVVIGPYSRGEADRNAADLRRRNLIPSDSFVTDGARFGQQFWPVGGVQPAPLVVETHDTDAATQTTTEAEATPAPPPPIQTPDESRQEAIASERFLDRDDKRELQRALKWGNHYTGAIDGLYGKGTRRSMEAWQIANNHAPTGVLTTGQRIELLAQYNAVFDGLGLLPVENEAAGIAMLVPTGVVSFDEIEPPFVKFGPRGNDRIELLMISQPGDLDRLFGLYEILQTLELMPTEGPRERGRRSFTLEGKNASIHSFATAEVINNQIKGFILIWPSGDDARRERVLERITNSFRRLDGVLDPAAHPPGEEQSIDLVSGLEIRKPKKERSGVFIDASGRVLTSSDAVEGCERVTIDGSKVASVHFEDPELGIAVVKPQERLAPLDQGRFQTAIPRLRAPVAVGGFPYGGVLSLPTLTFGTLEDMRSLDGDERLKRLSLMASQGDIGGPVIDETGALIGILGARPTKNGMVLPENVNYAIETSALLASLDTAGVSLRTVEGGTALPPERIGHIASTVTTLISCW